MNVTLESLHQQQEAVLKNLPSIPDYLPGRSIVTSCYRNEIPGSYILLSELKRLAISLPIEVFYRDGELADGEISELTSIWPDRIVFRKIQANAADFKDQWGNIKGWSTKVHAILESQYLENLWIDGDNFPIKNCLDLFNDDEYKNKGSLFWRDVYSIDRADQYCSGSDMWKIFQVGPNDGEPFESGQFLVNKPMVWAQLSMMKHYTDNCQIYYSFGGDAECWRMAWQYVSIRSDGYHARSNYNSSDLVPYGFMPYGPFHKGVQNQWHKYGGGSVMVQRDRKGQELFNHRNIDKFRWSGNNPYNEDIANESTYHMIMTHIKTKYGAA